MGLLVGSKNSMGAVKIEVVKKLKTAVEGRQGQAESPGAAAERARQHKNATRSCNSSAHFDHCKYRCHLDKPPGKFLVKELSMGVRPRVRVSTLLWPVFAPFCGPWTDRAACTMSHCRSAQKRRRALPALNAMNRMTRHARRPTSPVRRARCRTLLAGGTCRAGRRCHPWAVAH